MRPSGNHLSQAHWDDLVDDLFGHLVFQVAVLVAALQSFDELGREVIGANDGEGGIGQQLDMTTGAVMVSPSL